MSPIEWNLSSYVFCKTLPWAVADMTIRNEPDNHQTQTGYWHGHRNEGTSMLLLPCVLPGASLTLEQAIVPWTHKSSSLSRQPMIRTDGRALTWQEALIRLIA
eukprot:651815-Amphidinium_carterae.1